MISEHNEIEAKLDAPHVPIADFKKYVNDNYDVRKYKFIESPDCYYENGMNVVRHRIDNDHHELTVKRRKNNTSTRDRLEVDLHFSKRTEVVDVEVFLKATGFAEAFTIKKKSHIFWVQLTPRLEATFVIYDVKKIGETTWRRFVEIEAEKGSSVTSETGKRHVNACVADLRAAFKLEVPLNQSLYEIYSGKTYQSV